MRRPERWLAHVQVCSHEPAVHELDPCERTVPVHLVREPGVGRDIRVVPDPSLDVRRDVCRVVDLDLFRAHDRPASLGFHAAHDRVGGRVAVTHAVAVGNLEEPVPGSDRADGDRLEQDVES